MYFYPRSPCGERLGGAHVVGNVQLFLSTLSLRRATFCCAVSTTIIPNFYPRSPCGERPVTYHAVNVLDPFLSTLSLRRATACPLWTTASPRFLSTLSLRRATCTISSISRHITYFYPRSPCGERPALYKALLALADISIHALLAESDLRA